MHEDEPVVRSRERLQAGVDLRIPDAGGGGAMAVPADGVGEASFMSYRDFAREIED